MNGPLVNLEDFVKNNPKLKAKIIGKPVSSAATNNDKDGINQQAGKPNAELDGAERGVQTASKDNNMKKAIKEASMNISINGDSAAEVAELAGILKNAGMHDAKPVSPEWISSSAASGTDSAPHHLFDLVRRKR